MGISVYFDRGQRQESFPVAGQREINEIWIPIIQRHHLACLEQCVTAGLPIDAEIYHQILEEISAAREEIESRFPDADGPGSVVSRILRLHQFLIDNPPTEGMKLYIG